MQLKKGQFFFEDNVVYRVEHVKETHNTKQNLSYTVNLTNMNSQHMTTHSYAHNHHFRVVEPQKLNYSLTHLASVEDDVVFMSLSRLDTNETMIREDVAVRDDRMVKYLREHFDSDEAAPLKVHILLFEIDPAHRVDKPFVLEKITHLEGFDLTHEHDQHHGHHHQHV